MSMAPNPIYPVALTVRAPQATRHPTAAASVALTVRAPQATRQAAPGPLGRWPRAVPFVVLKTNVRVKGHRSLIDGSMFRIQNQYAASK